MIISLIIRTCWEIGIWNWKIEKKKEWRIVDRSKKEAMKELCEEMRPKVWRLDPPLIQNTGWNDPFCDPTCSCDFCSATVQNVLVIFWVWRKVWVLVRFGLEYDRFQGLVLKMNVWVLS